MGEKMRAILAVAVILALAWGSYWFIGAQKARLLAGEWMTAQDVTAELTLVGFPNRFDLTLTNITTAQGSYAATFVQVFAMSWKPWHLIMAFAPEQNITLRGQNLRVTSPHMLASLEMPPFGGTALRGLRVDSADLGLSVGPDRLLGAEHMTLGLEAGADDASPHFGGHLRGIIPSLVVADLPKQIDSLSVEGHFQLDRPLDLAQSLPNLLALDLTQARLIWGDLDMTITGRLVPDGMGYVSGDLAVTVTGAQDLPPILAALGLVTAEQGDRLKQALTLIGGGKFTLSLSDGMTRLGPITLGPAPLWPV